MILLALCAFLFFFVALTHWRATLMILLWLWIIGIAWTSVSWLLATLF